MICKHLIDGNCHVVFSLCGIHKQVNAATCSRCSKDKTPQSENLVTAGLAALAIQASGGRTRDYPKVYALIKKEENTGPGTELKKLISWFYVPDDSKCKCNDRINKMNKWGPDGCEERMDTIVRWLKHSAATHNVPFQETVVRVLIRRAISNARKAV